MDDPRPLPLRTWHAGHQARLAVDGEIPFITGYGQVLEEYDRLRRSVALLDLSHRGRLCVLGPDRIRFLNGQVTNDVRSLAVGRGCYAALCSARGRMEADAWIYRLEQELLLDLEPGLLPSVLARLEQHIIADDVQLADATPVFGLLSLQGPKAREAVVRTALFPEVPDQPWTIQPVASVDFGQLHLACHPRVGEPGYEVYGPVEKLEELADRLLAAVLETGGGLAGMAALEIARVEDGIPRYGVDIDATNLPPEAGIEERAISYRKGCYVGQEVIARIRTYGQVTKRLRGLRFSAEATGDGNQEPETGGVRRGQELWLEDRAVGVVTSVTRSPASGEVIGLGYVRREVTDPEAVLTVRAPAGDVTVRMTDLPFRRRDSGPEDE